MLPKNLKNKQALAILRVSTRRQESNNSHQVQDEKIRAYCKEFGLDLVDSLKIVESAKTSEERKQYSSAIAFALKQGIHNVLFYMNDREARNLTDNEKNEQLVQAGLICIHYVNERKVLHKESPGSDFFMRDMYAVQNKNFSRVLSEKVNDAMRKKAENGWFPGNRPPLGYVHQKSKDAEGREAKRGTIIVADHDLEKIRWVRREFQLRAEGKTLRQIRDQLLEEGLVPVKFKRSYSVHSVEHRLKNKFYWGSFAWLGNEYKGKHSLIIEPSILAKVRASFGLKGKYNCIKRKDAAFSGGWLRCGSPECGLQITYDPKKKLIASTGEVREYKYYRCANSRKSHSKLVSVSEEKIWDQLSEIVGRVHLGEAMADRISAALNLMNESTKVKIKDDIKNFRIALDEIEHKRNRAFDLLSAKAIDEEEFERQNKRLRTEQNRLTSMLEQSQLSNSDEWRFTAQRVFELAMTARSLWESATPEQKKDLLKMLSSNHVLEGKTLRYELKKPFSTLSKMASSKNWRSLRDSNPRYIREREVS